MTLNSIYLNNQMYVYVMSSHNLRKIHMTEQNLNSKKVRVTDLISRMNQEKKIEKKRNLALVYSR